MTLKSQLNYKLHRCEDLMKTMNVCIFFILGLGLAQNTRLTHGAITNRDSEERTGILYDPDDFNNFNDIYAHMQDYMRSCESRGLECFYRQVAYTYSGVRNYYFRVGTSGDKPVIWIDAAIYGRDWLTTATAVRIYNHLIENYGVDDEVTSLLDNYEVWIFPIANADGYIYTWDVNRHQKKNTRPITESCNGVDLNRNYDFNWARQGSDSSPCFFDYHGPSPASERDTQGYQGVFNYHLGRFAAFITMHSEGETWTYPYGNTVDFSNFSPCERTDDYTDLTAVAKAATDAIFESSGRRWRYGTSCEVADPNTGSAADWVKGVAGVKYAYTVSLKGVYEAPASEIEPSFQVVWQGIVAMINKVEEIEGAGFPHNK